MANSVSITVCEATAEQAFADSLALNHSDPDKFDTWLQAESTFLRDSKPPKKVPDWGTPEEMAELMRKRRLEKV
jgi:hypothetical protein